MELKILGEHTKEDLQEYAKIAQEILKGTQYQSNKETIKTLFDKEKAAHGSEDFKKLVKKRLTVIDSFYSTNMSKRLYGIDDLTENIAGSAKITGYSDEELKKHANDFLTTRSCVIEELLDKEYGINKLGDDFGKAKSLISKYLYFLNDCNFPIYDSLAEDSYKNLKNRGLFEVKPTINEGNYFEYMIDFKAKMEINDYGMLDNLLWLMGKLLKGSFSIIMSRKSYKNLTEQVGKENLKNKESSEKDKIIREYVKENYESIDLTLFSDDQKEFFEFVFDLKDK